jgi:hypothetical protein
MTLQPTRYEGGNLADVISLVLDRGLVINADIAVSLAGTELLGIKVRAALASFETAARYGLEFPSGTNLAKPAWKEAEIARESCPGCGKLAPSAHLLSKEGCPWCGWVTRKFKELPAAGSAPK